MTSALVLGILLLVVPGTASSQPRLPSEAPDDSKPILLRGDQAISWTEGNLHILVLRGDVNVEQGLLRARMKEAVVWLQPGEVEKGKPLPVLLYGEGDVVVQRNGVETKEAKVLLELKTRDEFRLRKNSLITRVATDHPFYRRAIEERQALLKPPTPAARIEPPIIRQTSATDAKAATDKPPLKGDLVQVIPREVAPPPAPPPGDSPLRIARRARNIRVTQRGSSPFQATWFPNPDDPNELIWVVKDGVSIFVEDVEGIGVVDISTDRAVFWVRSEDGQTLEEGLRSGEISRKHVEVYLEGHVEIRQAAVSGPQAGLTRTLRADQAYYDVSRNVAILTNGELISQPPGAPQPIHLRAREIRQVAPRRFEATEGEIFSSRLPSDPGVRFLANESTVEEREVPARGLFGIAAVDPRTGQPRTIQQLYSTADDVTLRVENVPIAYLPHVEGDLRDPLGPLERIRLRNDRVMGFGVLVDWDIFDLLGADRPPLTRWLLNTDYLSRRGPALGTEFETAGTDLFGLPGPYTSMIRAWGLNDKADFDTLGPSRDPAVPKDWRGRILARHRQEIGDALTFLGQFAYLSDRNFFEEFYKREFDEDLNQDTFGYLKYQRENYALTLLAEPNLRSWVNETQWLPRGDGYLIGQPLFGDWFTYYARASAGYAQFHRTSDLDAFGVVSTPGDFLRNRPLPPSIDYPNYNRFNVGRFDLWQELDLPFALGPFKFVPYGLVDLTHYTETLAEDEVTRLYWGGGMRASLPFTRAYPEITSLLFNVRGVAHRIVFSADYRYTRSSVGFRELPALDRLDDDATDQARRDLRAFRLANFPVGSTPFILATSPLYDPQLYAIRRGLETNIEARDDLQVLRGGIHQRWQTKRGFPGREHIIDWITLDLRGSYFPESGRDNFGESFAFLEYDFTWNIGDRTTILSTGWVDPIDDGARVFTIGLFLDRPERVNLYLGFRSIEPINSEAVIASTTYIFSPKYAATIASTYDFGERRTLGNTFVLSRVGTDLQLNLGLTYEALRNNFGVTFEIIPILAAGRPGSGLALLQNGR